MNASQRQNLINTIDTFKQIDIPNLIIHQFGAESKPEETSIGDYSLSEFYSLTKRVFAQLESRIHQPSMWQMLPASQQFQNDFGYCDLNSYCTHLIAYINANQYNDAVNMLKPLIYYQIINGFWEQPKSIDLDIRTQNLDNLESMATIVAQHSEQKRVEIDELVDEVEALKNELNAIKQKKDVEFDEITQNLVSSRVHLDAIREIQNVTTESRDNINTLQQECATITIALRDKQTSIIETQGAITKQQQNSEVELNRITVEATSKLKAITTDHKYVEEKKDKVKEMMGYIADGTLSHSFKSRKIDIKKSLNWWQWGSFVGAILMGGWIFVVFLYLPATNDNAIVNMLINVAKTSPMIALFWFALTQYQKERNLLEEYAFRETIAVTLTAYLDQLEGETDEHKRALLTNTVEKLYAKPKISSEGVGVFSIKSKDLVDLVKEVKDTLVEVKTRK